MKSDYVNEILDYLKSAFKVVEGNMDYFVDFQIERNLLTGDIFIHQTRYITYVLTRFGMLDAHSMTIPADYKSKLLKTLLGVILDPEVNVLYWNAVGCIMYCHCLTRPNISYSATHVAQYQKKPRQSHWTTVKRILRYLQATRTWGIRYRGQLPFLSLIGYCDADYGADLDDRKSRTGYAFLLGPSIIT
jgi:hypothetical protein